MHKPDWPTFTRIATREPSESGVIRQAAAFNRNLEDRLWGHASMLSANILGRFYKVRLRSCVWWRRPDEYVLQHATRGRRDRIFVNKALVSQEAGHKLSARGRQLSLSLHGASRDNE